MTNTTFMSYYVTKYNATYIYTIDLVQHNITTHPLLFDDTLLDIITVSGIIEKDKYIICKKFPKIYIIGTANIATKDLDMLDYVTIKLRARESFSDTFSYHIISAQLEGLITKPTYAEKFILNSEPFVEDY